jgi:glycosyltransferase involved in cell wall biosynthesis
MITDQPCLPQFRLLLLSQIAPEAVCHGIGLRAYHLLRHLPHEYQVTCLSADQFASPTPPRSSNFHRLHSFVQMQSPYRFEPELQRAFDKMLREQPFDAVLVMGVDLLQYTQHCPAPVIADLVDEPLLATLREICLQGLSVNSLRLAKHLVELLPYLRSNCRRARHCILVSQQDARWLRRIVPGAAVSVVPNGVDAEYFRPAGIAINPREIVFSGIMGFPPNIAATEYFARQVFPKIRAAIPDCQWNIVGGNPSPEVQALAGPNIRVTGFVPDLRPWLEQAAVVVSPLVSGGGMKNKILEAWAMGKAVVATPLGCAGVGVRDGVDLLVAHNASEFAAKTVHLLTHPGEARKIGLCAQQAVVANYAWNEKAVLLNRILRDAVSAPLSTPLSATASTAVYAPAPATEARP